LEELMELENAPLTASVAEVGRMLEKHDHD